MSQLLVSLTTCVVGSFPPLQVQPELSPDPKLSLKRFFEKGVQLLFFNVKFFRSPYISVDISEEEAPCFSYKVVSFHQPGKCLKAKRKRYIAKQKQAFSRESRKGSRIEKYSIQSLEYFEKYPNSIETV